MAAPKLKLTVKRGIPNDRSEKPGGEMIWLPVGDISLWEGRDGKLSGKLRVNALSGEFHVFEKTEEEDAPRKTAYRGQSQFSQSHLEEEKP